MDQANDVVAASLAAIVHHRRAAFSFTDANALTIDTVDGSAGITTNEGDITIPLRRDDDRSTRRSPAAPAVGGDPHDHRRRAHERRHHAGGGNVTLIAPAAPPLPSLSINDVTLTEGNSGNKQFIFTVTRSGSLSGVSNVFASTADGSATVADNDYTALP
jgi:hypothetical protein